MSKSLLYHAFGIRGYSVESTHFVGGTVTLWITQQRKDWRCPGCGSDRVYGRGSVTRSFRTVPIGAKTVTLVLDVPRVECTRCRRVRQVAVPFAAPRRRHTKNFERYVLELLRFGTIEDVARHLGLSWDTVKDIQTRHLHRRYARPKLKHLKEIAIDELHVGHGPRYLTLVLDLKSGVVVFVGDGKGSAALKPFWKRLKASHARVRAVAMDMAWGYINAVRDHLPNARIVFDRFHLMKLYNQKLSDLRRDLHREASDLMQKKVLKGTRWLLLKNPDNLQEKRRERERLAEALRLNAPLATAYYMKEDLRQFWEQPDRATAEGFLRDWIARAQCSGIRMLMEFARTLATFRFGLLTWYSFPISTGPLEGVNNKIQTMKRKAYGFRDPFYFKLRILALHETKYELVG